MFLLSPAVTLAMLDAETNPSWIFDQDDMCEGYVPGCGPTRLPVFGSHSPRAMISQYPTKLFAGSILCVKSYKSGRPSRWPHSWENTPTGSDSETTDEEIVYDVKTLGLNM